MASRWQKTITKYASAEFTGFTVVHSINRRILLKHHNKDVVV